MKHFTNKNVKIVFDNPNTCKIFIDTKFIKQINLDDDYDEVDVWDSFIFNGEVFDIHFCSDYGIIKNGYDIPDICFYELGEPDKNGNQSIKTNVYFKIENVEFMFEAKELINYENNNVLFERDESFDL